MSKSNVVQKVLTMKQVLDDLSTDLWNHPEPAFTEQYAAKRLREFLAGYGFEVQYPVAGIPTAFIARWGKGKPVIGLLAEYDALPAFSQKVQITEEPVSCGAAGHACGHNLMGAAHVGAAVAVKQELEEKGLEGTIILYGCPAEEILTGKVFMARCGLFDGLDCALNFHPGAVNGVNLNTLAGINNVKFNFIGKSSHAAARPFDGRSASDAAELMNVGANYLREHIPDGVRIHYVTLDGGKVPNVIANRAQTWYHIRAKERAAVDETYQRLIDVAKGAALMTGTSVEIDFQGGCYPSLQNRTLAGVVDESMREIGAPEYSDEEKTFAAALNQTCSQHPKRPYAVDPNVSIRDDILGPFNEGGFAYNASDIGDVAHLVPTTMFNTVCFNLLTDLHSWQVAACAGHSIGRKGMLFASQTLALTAIKLLMSPSLVADAKLEWEQAMEGVSYSCPIPPEVMPPIP